MSNPNGNFETHPKQEAKIEYTQFLRELDSLLTESPSDELDTKIKAFVDKRLKEFIERAKPKLVSFFSKDPRHRGFIHPKSEVKRIEMLDGFHVDDPDVYTQLVKVIQEMKEMPGWKEKELRGYIPVAVQHTLALYFGNVVPDSATNEKNKKFYMDRTTADSQPFSIRELKGQQMAVCVERAALAQNLLAFTGLDAELVISTKVKIDEQSTEGHAFNVVRSENGAFLYDPTNPILRIRSVDNVIEAVNPALYPLSADQYNSFNSGEAITIEHRNIFIDENGQTTTTEPERRTYALNAKP